MVNVFSLIIIKLRKVPNEIKGTDSGTYKDGSGIVKKKKGGSMIYLDSPAEDTETVITTKKKYKEPFPGYTIFGNGKETRNGGKSMDILEVCQQLNTAEMKLMMFFRDELERNKSLKEKNPNLVKPANCDAWDEYLKIALKKNYPHMECVGIIRRVKRGTYMLNPYLFIPPYKMVETRLAWEKLEENCNDK